MKKLVSTLSVMCIAASLCAAPVFAESADSAAVQDGTESAGESADGDSAGTDAAADGNSAGGESTGTDAAADGGSADGESAGTETASGDSAGGESSGGSGSGATTETDADTTIVTLIPEEMDELIIGEEGYEFTTDLHVSHIEIAEGAEITSQYPIIVFFNESESVENGTIIDNVQFVSDYDEVVAIVHTNDVHGHLEVEPYVKGLADQLKASGDYSLVLTVSAGDIYSGGEAVAGAYKGELIPAVVDLVYDYIIPGNNDVGPIGAIQDIFLTHLYTHTITLAANMDADEDGIPMTEIAENYVVKSGNEFFADLYSMVSIDEEGNIDLSGMGLEDLAAGESTMQDTAMATTANGTNIGIIGLTNFSGEGAKLANVDIYATTPTTQEYADKLREEGATAIIDIVHVGWLGIGSEELSTNDTNSWKLGAETIGVDVIIDSHTHSIINNGQGVLAGDDPTFVNQAQSVGECIGVCYMYFKDGEVIAVQGDVINDMTDITPDQEVQELVDKLLVKVAEDFGKPVGTTEYFLNGERLSAANEGGSIRGNETNLGDLFTDVMRSAISEYVGFDIDFVAYPGFLLRASIEPGDITLENVLAVIGTGGNFGYITYSAEEIVNFVSSSLSNVYPELEGTTFYHYSGLKLTYTNDSGKGTPVTVTVGDTLIYDANNGGLQVDESWSAVCFQNFMDAMITDEVTILWADISGFQDCLCEWFQTHTSDYYTIYPNTVAPDGRIVEVEK